MEEETIKRENLLVVTQIVKLYLENLKHKSRMFVKY